MNKSWKLIRSHTDPKAGKFILGGFPSPESAEQYNKRNYGDTLSGFSSRLFTIDVDNTAPYRTENGDLKDN